MSTGFVYLRPVYTMFLRKNGAYASSAHRAWQDVFTWLDQNRLRQKVDVGYGLLHDNPRVVSVDNCRYDACIKIPEGLESQIPAQFSVQKLPGGAFARTRHKGLSAELSHTIATMRDEWIPASGLYLDHTRPILEIYHDDPEIVEDGARKIDVCIPVSAQAQEAVDRSAA